MMYSICETPSFVNIANVCFGTFVLTWNRGVFLLQNHELAHLRFYCNYANILTLTIQSKFFNVEGEDARTYRRLIPCDI